MSSNTTFWDKQRGIINTNRGGWVIGKGISSHGYALLDDLVGCRGFFQVMVLNVTGRLPEKKLTDWIEASFICLSWPDPRIWCNQIGSYGGMTKASPVASITAGTLASDSKIYGAGTTLAGAKFITSALEYVRDGGDVESFIESKAKLKGRLIVPGFARPIATGDERVLAMQTYSGSLGFEDGEYLKLAYQIQEYLLENYNESLNLAGYIIAFLSDLGYSAQEIYRIYSLCVNSGVHATYSEAYDNPPDAFLPLRCDDVVYVGHSERSVPVRDIK